MYFVVVDVVVYMLYYLTPFSTNNFQFSYFLIFFFLPLTSLSFSLSRFPKQKLLDMNKLCIYFYYFLCFFFSFFFSLSELCFALIYFYAFVMCLHWGNTHNITMEFSFGQSWLFFCFLLFYSKLYANFHIWKGIWKRRKEKLWEFVKYFCDVNCINGKNIQNNHKKECRENEIGDKIYLSDFYFHLWIFNLWHAIV